MCGPCRYPYCHCHDAGQPSPAFQCGVRLDFMGSGDRSRVLTRSPGELLQGAACTVLYCLLWDGSDGVLDRVSP